MNALRLNLFHALLSIVLLVTMVSVSRPDNGTAATTQILRATHAAASAVCNFHGLDCTRGTSMGRNPAAALQRVVEQLVGGSVS